MKDRGTTGAVTEMEMVSDPEGSGSQGKILPSSIAPIIEAEIPASEADFLPKQTQSNQQAMQDEDEIEVEGESAALLRDQPVLTQAHAIR